jgi:REP element-mobilizing transposase RayT
MRELQQRKHPRLKGHDYSQKGAYFITFCVKDKHEMLGRIVGRDAHIAPSFVELSEYGEIVKKHIEAIDDVYSDVNVDRYIIMPNHIHMIVTLGGSAMGAPIDGAMRASRPTKTSIPTIMRSLKTLVTREIGFSMWQTSYHDHIIRSEEEYMRIRQYIDENPITWLCDCYFV